MARSKPKKPTGKPPAVVKDSGFTYIPILGMPGGVIVDSATGAVKVDEKGNAVYRAGTPSRTVSSQQHLRNDLTGFPNVSRQDTQFPKYVSGDEFKPAASLSPDEIIDLQNRMDKAGLYPKGAHVVMGVWGNDDTNAYRGLLEGANASYSDYESYLTQLMNNPVKDTTDKAEPIIALTSADDIRATARQVAKNLYGGNLPEGTVNNMIDAFHNMETQYQQTTQQAGIDNTAATATQPPNVQNFIEEQTRRDHPEQVAATEFGNHFDAILQTLTGNGT